MDDDTSTTIGTTPLEPLGTVMTTLATDSEENGFSPSLMTFAAVMTFLIMIVGICGNFLTVVALLKCPKVRNVAAAFIISLCIADLLFCALVLPFQGLRFVQGTWRHGAVLCRIIPFIQYGNIGVSLLCIAMITINRYVMITHHGYYARIYKRHWIAIMIAACWLFSYGMQLPTLLGIWGRFGYDTRLKTCSIMSDSHGHSSKTTLFITAFVIPCMVIIACYAKIFWVVHKSEQRLKSHANKQNSIPNNLRPVAGASGASASAESQTQAQNQACRVSSDSSSYSTDVPEPAPGGGVKQQPSRVKDQREVRAKRNEWRITKMVLAIFLSFVICYLPITIVKVADNNVEHPSLHIFSYIMLYLSACINPIIYVIMNKQYRKAYKTVVLCQPSRLLLPFGKTNGASSAAEKWKDTGLSNNHSRTLVSQMSAGGTGTSMGTTKEAPPSPSLAPAQGLELMSRPGPDLITKSNLPLPQTQPQLPPPPPPPSVTNLCSIRLPIKKSNHSYINSGFNNSSSSSSNNNIPTTNSNPTPISSSSTINSNPMSGIGSSIYRPSTGGHSAPIRRITMVGDDIILEEEELPSTPPPTPPTVPPPPPPSVKTAPPTTPIYMNVNSPKRNQTYTQTNSSVNNLASQPVTGEAQDHMASKVSAKLKFPKD
ncbi:G-protein coupled receptor moody [Drosophila willistoni]|uniref:G-protein coupled receptor moody n=1 Tax=Drosophila willistoni TaxID=7260 RepID=UPI000C26D800|nr:G-protein coupled receptor moody [Drosophila willistoni]XP_023035355.1 G-protein coupled receptor moody [Drosophila willistoni]